MSNRTKAVTDGARNPYGFGAANLQYLLSYQPKLTVQEAIDVFLERERTLDALTEAGKDLDSDPVHIAPLHDDRSTT